MCTHCTPVDALLPLIIIDNFDVAQLISVYVLSCYYSR